MKKLKTKISLVLGAAILATFIFATPVLACGKDHDNDKFIHGATTKSWFGVHTKAWQDKGYVEPTPAVEEPVAEPVQEEQVQKNQDIETSVQEQPVIEEPASEKAGVETPVQEQPVIEKPVSEEAGVETQNEEEHTGFINDEEEELYVNNVEEKHEKTEERNEYKPWLKSRASITKDNRRELREYELNKSSNWKTRVTAQAESGSWVIEPTQKHTPWHPTSKSINNKKERGFIHAWNPAFPDVEEHETSNELQPIHFSWGYSFKDETIRTLHSIAIKSVYAPWEMTASNFANSNPKTVFVDMMGSKHHIYPSTGHNGITKQGQTTTIYNTHNSNTDMRTKYIRGLGTVGPYAVNSNKNFNEGYFKHVQRQIQHVGQFGVIEDNIYKKDSTQLREKGLDIKINRDGFANESTRKDISFILLRHGVPVIHNNESRIQPIYPAKVFEDTLSKGKYTPFITKHFVPVFDNASTTKSEKPGTVKVRLYRPFTTSNSSSNTKF